MKSDLTDEQVEQEIKVLSGSPLVKLGRKEQRIKYARRQRLYVLRYLEKRGRELQENGVTMEMLDELAKEQREADGFDELDDDSIF